MKLNEIERQLLTERLKEYVEKSKESNQIALQVSISEQIVKYVELATPSVFPTYPPDSKVIVVYDCYHYFFEMKRLPSHADKCIPKGVRITLPESHSMDEAVENYIKKTEHHTEINNLLIHMKVMQGATIEILLSIGYPRHLIPEGMIETNKTIWERLSQGVMSL